MFFTDYLWKKYGNNLPSGSVGVDVNAAPGLGFSSNVNFNDYGNFYDTQTFEGPEYWVEQTPSTYVKSESTSWSHAYKKK